MEWFVLEDHLLWQVKSRHAVLVPGWIDDGLPICTEVDEAHSYAGLKQRAGL